MKNDDAHPFQPSPPSSLAFNASEFSEELAQLQLSPEAAAETLKALEHFMRLCVEWHFTTPTIPDILEAFVANALAADAPPVESGAGESSAKRKRGRPRKVGGK